MKFSQSMFIMAAVYMAPHVEKPNAVWMVAILLSLGVVSRLKGE